VRQDELLSDAALRVLRDKCGVAGESPRQQKEIAKARTHLTAWQERRKRETARMKRGR